MRKWQVAGEAGRWRLHHPASQPKEALDAILIVDVALFDRSAGPLDLDQHLLAPADSANASLTTNAQPGDDEMRVQISDTSRDWSLWKLYELHSDFTGNAMATQWQRIASCDECCQLVSVDYR